ncbi:MAG: AhpC/TSA family protein [Cyanobacteria bacterium SBLK]|nr:AhpC/TSA family protein [Cyanobacteria bacterium SBLK]
MKLTQYHSKSCNLNEQLSKKRKELETRVILPDKLTVIDKEIERITRSGIVENCLQVGDRIPDFSLLDTDGETIDLQTLLTKELLVISFYRGNWCPYCNLELKALETIYQTIKTLNASLVAISPQNRKYSLSMREKRKLSFPVLSDPDNQIARLFGIVHQVPEHLWHIYQELQADFTKYNQHPALELPLPATFICQAGTIAYSFVDPDYTQRLDPVEIVSILKQLSGN